MLYKLLSFSILLQSCKTKKKLRMLVRKKKNADLLYVKLAQDFTLASLQLSSREEQ